MKYLLKVLIILCFILFLIKCLDFYFDKGHSVNYSVGNFTVKEKLVVDGFNGTDNYYFSLKNGKFKIGFQVNKDYNKKPKIIKKIKYKKIGKYECILPIYINGDINSDIMCKSGDTIYYGYDVNDPDVLEFKKSLKSDGYDYKAYIDSNKSTFDSGVLSVNYKNIVNNHYIAVENYKGVSLLGSEVRNINLFTSDVYKKPVSIFTDKYYVVADYSKEYSFKSFYVVNLINGNMKEIRSYNDISFDSVMQGYIGDNVYLFDKDSQTQYKIDISNEMIKEVGDKDNLKYYDGKWKSMNLVSALEGKLFENYKTYNVDGYDKAIKVGSKVGYYYLFKKFDNGYDVYRADVQNMKYKTYLFHTSDLSSFILRDNYIYFMNGNSVYYNFDYGIRKVFTDSEIEFNDDIDYGVSVK